MIEFKEITKENFWQIVNLKLHESQREYLPSNAVFMAQAFLNLKLDYPDVCFAIYKESLPVGFTKIVYVPKCEDPYQFAENSYMIDHHYQGNGYGKEALNHLLKYIKTKPLSELLY